MKNQIYIKPLYPILYVITILFYFNVPLSSNSTEDVLVFSLREELNRSIHELSKADLQPYFISYHALETIQHNISSKFGKINNVKKEHKRVLDVMLRVGDHKLDNTEQIRGQVDFGGWIESKALPIENDEAAIRNVVWNATANSYKTAVEQYVKAKANKEIKVTAEDTSANFSVEEPTNYTEPLKNIVYYNELTKIYIDPNVAIALDSTKWNKLLCDLSEEFVKHTWILDGTVSLQVEINNKIFLSTEGSQVVVSEPYLRIYISASCKAEDGMLLPLYHSYFAFDFTEFPDADSIRKDINTLINTLDQLRNAELAPTFTGPAILSGEASGVFLHEILGHRVEGFREKDPDYANTFKNLVGQKVLPDFVDITFDPDIKYYNNIPISGYYKYDDEGIKAEKVESIKKGIFQKYLMSRSPIEGFDNSNGHGRKRPGYSAVTRQSNLIVTTSKPLTNQQLRTVLIDEARKQGKDFGLFFDKVAGGFTQISRFSPNAFNVTPLVVYKIYVDGRPDEIVRGVDLIGTPLSTFSNITATGDDFGIFNGICGAESGGIPVSSVSPSVVVSQIEVQKKLKSQSRPPILESPLESATTP